MTDVDTILADVKIIDADTHIIEPYDLWTSRVSVSRWGDLVPHVVWSDERQCEIWVSGDQWLGLGAGVGVAGYEKAPPDFPPRWGDIKPEVWRAADRLEVMTRYGIYAAILYPNISGFGAGNFVRTAGKDTELARQLIEAYNDFLVDFCSIDPCRYIPVMGLPFWDVDLSIAEMERCVGNGHKGIIFSQQPELYGQQGLGSRHWDRLWAATQEMQLSVNFHIGSGDQAPDILPPEAGKRANFASRPVLNFIGNTRAIATMIGAGVCHRFPDLKIVSVESGVGWIPFVLQTLDWMWKLSDVVDEHPEYDLLPSEYFRRQIYGCFWFESGDALQTALDFLGDDHVLYETDYPHPASMSPGPASPAPPPREFIAKNLHTLNESTLRKVLHDNAAALYHLE
jgi:predicted TIM-barrel fold metal-dependent hydrolase